MIRRNAHDGHDRCPYFIDDVYALIEGLPYLQLRGGSYARILREMRQRGQDYFKFLHAYPGVQCEFLEFHYRCKQCIDTLDTGVMHALLNQLTFRGAYVGIFLAALAPRREFRSMLVERQPHLPHAADAIDLALCIIDGQMPAGQETRAGDLELIRRQLAQLPDCSVPLRPEPDRAQGAQIRQETESAKEIYRTKGADAVLAYLPGTMRQFYMQSHKDWLAAGAKPWQPDKD
jgi:hypothetical protein